MLCPKGRQAKKVITDSLPSLKTNKEEATLNKTHYREWGWGEPDKVFYEKKRQPFHMAVTYDKVPFQLTYKLSN